MRALVDGYGRGTFRHRGFAFENLHQYRRTSLDVHVGYFLERAENCSAFVMQFVLWGSRWSFVRVVTTGVTSVGEKVTAQACTSSSVVVNFAEKIEHGSALCVLNLSLHLRFGELDGTAGQRMRNYA